MKWLKKVQKENRSMIHLKLFDDGSGGIEQCPYDEDETIIEFSSLKELEELASKGITKEIDNE